MQGKTVVWRTMATKGFLSVAVICAFMTGCSVAATSKKFVFHDKRQEEFAGSLNDFIFSVPTRVGEDGQFLTHKLHAKHSVVKRSADPRLPSLTGSSSTGTGSDATGDVENVIHYRIPIHEEKEVIVRVWENTKLLSPGAVVETKSSKFKNVSDSEFRTLHHKRGCHYTGTVLGDETSRVALAACDGLTGFFHSEGEQYLIEPVKGHNHEADPQHPHIVYKRSALPAHLNFAAGSAKDSAKEGSCGVNDNIDRIIKRRERWERHRRHAEQKTKEAEEEKGVRRRRKRSISSEKNVETLIVVDPDMMKYYQNEDIENYVLTVMNMVATLFHDASIGNAVNIVIVRMLLLKDPDEELQITHHADKTLRSFCKWQKSINFRDDDHPNHHDVALLLTRRNICNRMNQPCSTLGLAQVSGMCQPHRSCNINEDTGLSLAWTVTHELGHNFAMKHDTVHNDCESPMDEMYVMAPHLSWDMTPTRWSNCSRQSITKFLDRHWGYCLDDEPGHHDFEYPMLPAGTMYDADHQCRLLYGEEASICGGVQDLENICSTLWCRVDNKCSTKLQPAAEGTICGTNRWCFAGKCVEIGDRPQAINGEWGEWSGWTPCTRTCGAGVSHSERLCNHPPPSNGGKYCIGERKRYRICNTEECPDNGISFRHVQCAEFNEIPYKGHTYEWVPISTPETPCQLHCKPKDMFFSVLLKDIATDGTPCVPGARHMCISGRCRHVGCDWEIDSSATEDRCGVCYGDGSTCTTIKQQFNETKEHGYVEATVIPQGARNIRVEEVAEASNFLALRNEEGKYYLNGHWFIQWSGDYEMAGTIVRYSRQGNKESFMAQGPLKEPLHIMLLMQTHNPGVVFEYTVPNENATDTREPEFRWDYADWSHCTLSCGGGTQRSEVVCMEKEAGRVDEMFCDRATKPDDRLRSCNEHLCPARWWKGPWQHCSVTCGDNGTHKRTVMCVRSLGEDEQIALEDSACEGLDKPVAIEPCRSKDTCPGTVPQWVVGNWTQCNGNPCAVQSRSVLCNDVTVGCDPFTRPPASQACSNITCGTWKTEPWSTCTRTCKGGVQYRKVTCTGSETCDLDLEPPSQQPCGDLPCPEPPADNSTEVQENQPDTKINPESSSTAENELPGDNTVLLSSPDSGISLETNSVEDTAKNIQLGEAMLQELENSVVEGGSPNTDLSISPEHPTSSEDTEHKHRHHHGNHHKHHHENHDQNQQTPEAGLGDDVTVQGGGTDDRSNEPILPEHMGILGNADEEEGENLVAEEQQGIVAEKEFEWYAGEWRKCSSACGGGVQTRAVSCFRVTSKQKVDPEFCSIQTKPSAIQECNDEDCLDWTTSEWGQCSATCGHATQSREVLCPEPNRCDPKFKPQNVRACSLQQCIAWVTGDWSKCTKTCDGGTQHRLVQCVNMTSQQLSHECDEALRPALRQSCNTDECPSTDAAFTVTCESNEMSYRVCRMLKKVGLCHKDYVQAKCCRTCTDHSRQSPPNRISDRR